jgi:GT2 family glycosyltransferase
MIIIALPGNSFYGPAFLGLIQFINYLDLNEYKYMISMEGGGNVSSAREKCLGMGEGGLIDYRNAIPFEGAIDYSHILWIDSDTLFDPPDFKKLLDRDVDIVAGCCKKDDKLYTVSKYEVREGESMMCLEDKDLTGEDLIEARGFGFAFVLIKRGVFEKIERPWFETTMKRYAGKEHFVGEDIFFCLKAQEYGFKLWIDPTVKVKHLKPRLL